MVWWDDMVGEVLTADGIDARVVRVGDGQGELGAGVPSLGRSFWVCVVEVDRDHIVRLTVRIALGEEEYSPGIVTGASEVSSQRG